MARCAEINNTYNHGDLFSEIPAALHAPVVFSEPSITLENLNPKNHKPDEPEPKNTFDIATTQKRIGIET